MKGRKDSNNNNNAKIGSTPRQAEFWDKDSSSSDDEPETKHSKKKPCNKMVKRIHYQRNSTVLLSEIVKYLIDINTPDKFHRLRMLHSVLSTTGLLTLIEGHRTEPIMTEENTHGFSNRKIILVPRVEYEDEKSIDSMSSERIIEIVVLEEDDAFHYIHDNDRLFSLVYIMISKTLHHNISIRNQKLRNGIESYRDMINYIFGQKQQDVKFARRALDTYQINPSVHFRLEYSKSEQLFSNLEHAQSRMMTDVEKMAWVSDRLDSDPRLKIASSFTACVVNNTSYNESMGIMLRAADAMPPETAVIRMASVTSFPETSSSSEYSLYQNTIQNQSQAKLSQYQVLSNPPQTPGKQTQYNPNYNYDIENKNKIQDEDHYLKVLVRVKDQLKMVDTVLDSKKALVIDQHANTSMK